MLQYGLLFDIQIKDSNAVLGSSDGCL